jgi:4,5:9,10-diseco-3-hydroxy-5,9,17-trioxoandrosta-1(10),2-diene-4-oate hydrolase
MVNNQTAASPLPAYYTCPDQYVEIQGIKTRYWKAGSGQRTIVLVHGFTGSLLEWVSNMPVMAQTYTVYALDLPGHGRTGKPSVTYDYDFFASFLNHFFQAMGISKAALLGHSMGGIIVLNFCILHPEKAERLILIDPPYSTRFPLALHILTVPFVGEHLLRPPSSLKAVRDGFRIVTLKEFAYDEDSIRNYYEFQHSAGYAQALLSYLRGTMHPFGLTKKGRHYVRFFDQETPKLNHPIFLTWGKQDRVVPFECAAHLKELIRNGEFWDVDQCGHSPHFEYADEFNRRVLEFLEKG